jgi:hypothetical protein
VLPSPAQEAFRGRSGARAGAFDDRAAGMGNMQWDTDAGVDACVIDVSGGGGDGALEPSPRRTPGDGGGGGDGSTGFVQRMIRSASRSQSLGRAEHDGVGVGGGGGGGGGGVAAAGPTSYGDLLAPLEPSQQVVLRFERICSYVSSQLQPPSLAQRAAQTAKWLCAGGGGAGGGKRGAPEGGQSAATPPGQRQGPFVTPPQRQILYDISGRVLPGAS